MAAANTTCLQGPGKCFPMEPCLSDADCFNGRWPCRNGLCTSDLVTFSQAYFATINMMANVLFVFTVCPTIFLYGKVKGARKARAEREIDRQKQGSKADQMRRSLVPAMTFTPFDNPMYNGNQQGFSSNPSQFGSREDEFYAEKVRGGGLVNAAGMNWRQSVMMSDAPQMRADALARQRNEQRFGGMMSGVRSSVMYQENVQPMMNRMGRAVSRMYNERQLGAIYESARPGGNGPDMPNLDKIFRHADLCADMVAGEHGAQTMNINVRALQGERAEAVRLYRILAYFLKLLQLDANALNKIKDRIAQPVSEVASLMNEAMKGNGNPDKQREALQRAMMMSRQLIIALTSMDGPFAPFNGAENWQVDSPEMLALDEYVNDCVYLFDDVDEDEVYSSESATSRCCRKTANTFGIPDSIRLHPWFYLVYFFVQLALIVSFFIGKCDLFNTEEFAGLNITFNGGLGNVPATVCLKGKTRTYFGIGEQYATILGKGTQTDISIPLLYGIMHQLLFLFGTLPVPMARGLWRDVAYYLPVMKRILPIDTAYFFHMFVGYMALFSLFFGASIWTIEMGLHNCLGGFDKSTCTAFDLRNVKEFINPIENVVMLRVIIIILWTFVIPLMRWRGEPPFFLPQIIKKYWFEICYISHVTVALATFILALAARFTVFFPIIAPWTLYILDSWRETLFMTFRSQIDMSRSYIHTDPAENNKPTTMTIRFTNPERSDLRGGIFRKNMIQGVGTWVYLKVPSVSNIEWHPFSIASATGDDFLQLQIGIRPGQPKVGYDAKDSWVLKENSFNGDKQWIMDGGETWTYKLYQTMKEARGNIDVIFRGPYGCTFNSIFDPSTKGAIIIGAGTGLSAVESVLRAMLYRKMTGQYTPPHIWVMWQTRRVGDLLWLWDSLNQLLIDGLNNGTIEKSKIWSPQKSQYLGFIGLTFFISRADQNQLDTLRSMPRHPGDVHNLHTWLTNRSRILQSSLSNEKTHIRKYVKHIRAFMNRAEGRNSRLSIGFCGPTPVAKIISDAASDYGKVEFSYATE